MDQYRNFDEAAYAFLFSPYMLSVKDRYEEIHSRFQAEWKANNLSRNKFLFVNDILWLLKLGQLQEARDYFEGKYNID